MCTWVDGPPKSVPCDDLGVEMTRIKLSTDLGLVWCVC